MNILQFPLEDAVRLNADAAAGNEDAKAFFSGLFPDGGACFLCDAETPPGAMVAMIVSPDDASQVLATPMCAACCALPPMVKTARELRMLRAIWPNGRWRLSSDKNSRGRRVKGKKRA